MDAAAYGVIGAALGSALTGFVTIVTARTNAQLRMAELEAQDRRVRTEMAAGARKEKAHRYATFLSAFWQEERFASEMLEHLSARRRGWSDAITRINNSPEHHSAIATLNESIGWLSVLCGDPEVEGGAQRLSAEFDMCPWNERFASELREPAFAAREALRGRDARTLAREVLQMTQAEFSAAYKGSPMKRAKLRGLRRNAAVVLGNVGTANDADVLTQALQDDEALVREHAAWALGRLGP